MKHLQERRGIISQTLDIKSHFWSLNFLNVLNIWAKCVGVQPYPNLNFFMSLKNFQNIDIEYEFAFSIWSYMLKVMAKKRSKILVIEVCDLALERFP